MRGMGHKSDHIDLVLFQQLKGFDVPSGGMAIDEQESRSFQISEFLPPVGDLWDEGLLDPVCPDLSRDPACRLARPRAEMNQLSWVSP